MLGQRARQHAELVGAMLVDRVFVGELRFAGRRARYAEQEHRDVQGDVPVARVTGAAAHAAGVLAQRMKVHRQPQTTAGAEARWTMALQVLFARVPEGAYQPHHAPAGQLAEVANPPYRASG